MIRPLKIYAQKHYHIEGDFRRRPDNELSPDMVDQNHKHNSKQIE